MTESPTKNAALSCYEELPLIFHPLYEDEVFSLKMADPMPDNYAPESRSSFEAKTPEEAILGILCDHPILSREQEIHLFQQFNFEKHQANSLLASLTQRKRVTKQNLQRIADLHKKIIHLKNFIYSHYGRYIVKLTSKTRDVHDNLGNGTILAMLCIDKYDWSMGYRFTTYLSNAFFRSFRHEMNLEKQVLNGTVKMSDLDLLTVEQKNQDFEDREKTTTKLMDFLDRMERDYPQDIRMIKARYLEFKTLETLGKEMKKTKERVRQREVVMLGKLRMYIEDECPEIADYFG